MNDLDFIDLNLAKVIQENMWDAIESNVPYTVRRRYRDAIGALHLMRAINPEYQDYTVRYFL